MGAGPDSGARAGADARRGVSADRSESEIRTAKSRDGEAPSVPPRSGPHRRERESTQEIRIRTASEPIAETELEPFARFGRFDLLGRIATGGMAEILLARESVEDAVGSRHVVIKAVRGEFAEAGDFAKMFLDEGRLAMRLTHPNICTVYECGRNDGRFFIAMEYVHGRTLREVLVRAAKSDRPLPIPVLLRVFALVGEALDFAHRAKDSQGRKLSVVHRDVSPHNIMLRYDGVVKLLDFGVAKAEHSQHSTESGALKGKFSYMSPEQAMGSAVDARADIFSLGVCMFEAVTGRRLFQRKAQYDTLKAILEMDHPPLASFRDDVPARLEEIVSRALAKDPEVRYQRASDLQHDIESLLNEMREVASTSRIAEVMEDLFTDEAHRPPALEIDAELRERYQLPAPPAAPIEQSEAPRAPGVPRWAWIAALLLVAGLGAGGLWVALRGPQEPAARSERQQPASTEPAGVASDTAPAEPSSTEPAPPADRSSADPTLAEPAPEPPGSAPVPGDGTLHAAEAPEAAPATGAAGPASPREEASPRSPRPPRRETPERPGARPTRGTVIVTDPGF